MATACWTVSASRAPRNSSRPACNYSCRDSKPDRLGWWLATTKPKILAASGIFSFLEIRIMEDRNKVQRSVLPIPDVQHPGLTVYDAKDPDSKFPAIRDLRPPKGAPNVVLILIDDVGYGATSTFGGPCNTPNFEKLA